MDSLTLLTETVKAERERQLSHFDKPWPSAKVPPPPQPDPKLITYIERRQGKRS